MATQAIDQSADGDAAAAAPAGASKKIMTMAIAGVIAGTSVGLFVVGPIVAAKKPPAAAVEKKKEEPVTAAINHSIENLVLNPAGTGGARFLMVTAVFQLKDGGAEQMMKEHEPEVRDRILNILGKKGVDELGDITKRDGIKKEVLDGVAPLFAKNTILKLFFSQFVIQ